MKLAIPVILFSLISCNASTCVPLGKEDGPALYAYGDSITGICHSWAEMAAAKFGSKFIQRSVGGTTIDSANQTALLTDVFEPGSRIVFAPGHNDAILNGADPKHLKLFRETLTAIVARLSALPVTVYIGTPIRFTDVPPHFETKHNSAVDEYAKITREVVAGSKVNLVDFHACFKQTPANSRDGLHPNDAGMAEMFKCF